MQRVSLQHEKLGEYHRLQYLAMLQPAPARAAVRMLLTDPGRFLRLACFSRWGWTSCIQ
jgi:hypothetical protein